MKITKILHMKSPINVKACTHVFVIVSGGPAEDGGMGWSGQRGTRSIYLNAEFSLAQARTLVRGTLVSGYKVVLLWQTTPFISVASNSKDDFLLKPLAHHGLFGALLHVSSPNWWSRPHFQPCLSPRQRERELWRALHTVIKCPDVARVTSIHNSLARINHQASPKYKRAKKYNLSMCSAGA